MIDADIVVSVCMITYRQELFIAQAIESILAQHTSFKFKLVIGEDSSPDKTRQICEEYAEKYGEIIELLPSYKNYGAIENFKRTLAFCTSKYIAICEGDDYWIDENKLQKQVDFLDKNKDFSSCFSLVEVKDELGWNKPYDFYFPKYDKNIFTIEDFILSDKNIIPTGTVLFRNVIPNPLPDYFSNIFSGDIALQLIFADKGKAMLFNEKLAVYRNHGGGVSKSKENILKGEESLIDLYTGADKYFGYRYASTFKKRLQLMYKTRLFYGAKDIKNLYRFGHYLKYMPKYIKYSDNLAIKDFIYISLVVLFPRLLRKK
ncbi:hypothetical protein CJD36_007560 [Flavipsychrobacter stenotrophus]|uniref:Glycosyltransferase 2-like domain-containing protein n=1 Tax=Flavipsychrobacter stenotrophus TaxID=2077091 RepID=A0A2S7SY45_9BACT|nr:glycosyltransferase [Flavipsychrobacter stenotrophus]PQJ11644.1 hypothetical protein CJD36_007560 [Flavipsychrobacter stenotrophus]